MTVLCGLFVVVHGASLLRKFALLTADGVLELNALAILVFVLLGLISFYLYTFRWLKLKINGSNE